MGTDRLMVNRIIIKIFCNKKVSFNKNYMDVDEMIVLRKL